MVITKKLDLNVLGFVKESFNEDGSVAKGGLGLGSSTLEALLQGLGFTNNSHTSATTTIGSLDNDGKAILVGEGLNLFVPSNSTLGTGNDWDTSLDGKRTGRDLVAKSINDIRLGTDELYRCKRVTN